MSDLSPSPDISADDWAATPATVRVVVADLLERVARLEERANKTSRTSSKPPSSDPPSAPPRPARRPSGRASGGQPGQPGQPGHGRVPLPADRVGRVVDVKPDACACCGASLTGDDPDPACHQVAELPRVVVEVTAYRRHTLRCGACGARTAAWPGDKPSGSFGPRAQATVASVTGRQGVSQRDAQEMRGALFHLELSVGSIAALERRSRGRWPRRTASSRRSRRPTRTRPVGRKGRGAAGCGWR